LIPGFTFPENLAMTQPFWKRALQQLFAGRPADRRGRPARHRPVLEPLEERTLLSTLMVANLLDSGDGSLRARLAAAASGDTIAFDPSLRGTLTLTGGELAVATNLTIQGPGAAALTVSGGGAQRVFHILPGAAVTISGLTIANGNVPDFGAGIESEGSLTLLGTTLTGNTAGQGGGGLYFVVNNTGPADLTVTGSTFTNNSAATGAGLFSSVTNRSGRVDVTVNATTFSNNTATGPGGGIDSLDSLSGTAVATFTVNGGVFGTNQAGAQGGGLATAMRTADASQGTVTLSGATFQGNTAGGSGGGVSSELTSSGTSRATATFTGNVLEANAAAAFGGGLFSTVTSADDATAALVLNSVFGRVDANTAANGGGIASQVLSSGSGSAAATFTSQVFFNTASQSGGGLYSTVSSFGSGPASATLSGTGVFANQAFGMGGGVYSQVTAGGSGSATATVSGGSVTDNTAGTNAGGLYGQVLGSAGGSAALAVTSSFISENAGGTAGFGDGGGVYLSVSAQDTATASGALSGDTVSGNSTAGSGGGVFLFVAGNGSRQAAVTVGTTTVNDNSAGLSGGGIFASESNSATGQTNLTLGNDTVSANTASSGGGISLGISTGFFSPGQATASVTNTSVTDNTAHSPFANGLGGGISVQLSNDGVGQTAVTLTGAQVSGNRADANGGGIYASLSSFEVGPATLTVAANTLSGNSAGNLGGGLYDTEFASGPSRRTSTTVALTGSAVAGNRAGSGGGLYFDLSSSGSGATAGATVTASTVEGNSAGGQGGGVYAQELATAATAATLALTNSTLFGNAGSDGGGLLNNTRGPAGTVGVVLLSDTVAFNSASSTGGGLEALGDRFTLRSTLVAANTAGSGPDALGNFTSGGHNLVGQADGSGGWVASDLTGTSASPLDARPGNFGNNGGPTRTLALMSDSPAIGKGDPAGPAADQRGVVRSTTAPTIGAFEFVQPSSFLVTPAFPDVAAGTGFSITVSALDSAGNVLAGYTGTIHFTSSDGGATLPADYTFTPADAGRHTFTLGVTLQTKGPQTVTVTGDGATGSAAVTVTDPVGTWAALAHTAPAFISTMLLLTDGTVLAEGLSGPGAFKSWYRLTPDAHGSYVNGAWSQVASMGLERLYFGSNVLPDGRVFLVGGEFTGPSLTNNNTNTGEIYDPRANTWTPISNFPQPHFGDDPTALLPDGRILGGYIGGPQTYIYDPASNTWTFAANKLLNDRSDEETWVTLPDGSVLSYDVFHDGHAQRYFPAQNQWVDAGNVPVTLSGSSQEQGGAFRLPDGRVLFLGATGHTALYDPATNSWAAGPDIPAGLVTDDAPGAMMPNGHVLFSADHPGLQGPTTLFEYDPVGNTMTPVLNAPSLPGAAFGTRMLMLPSGQVLFTNGGTQLYAYTPHGDSIPAGQPTIAGVADNGDGTFTLTGTQLNGISEGASYGDDAEMSTNYPIIRLVDAAGNVFYARTFNWNIGVATGDAVVSTQFTLPAGIPAGTYSLFVVANGIASTPVDFTVSSGASATGLDGLSPPVWPGSPPPGDLGDGLA
jgi:hypothetical protein